MNLNLDVTGRRVLVIGDLAESRHVFAAYRMAGAEVFALEQATVIPADVRSVAVPSSHREWSDLIGAVDLVVAVGPLPSHLDHVAVMCRDRRTWFSDEPAAETSAVGSVTLVGGGPGSGEFLTIAARTAMRNADVILHDRLGPTESLAALAPGACLIDVGKTPGHHAVSQARIESLLVEHALAGRTVVRLKGGDPFVFGRGGEEVIACVAAGIRVRVIPGVSSAIAVPGAAGIPVTHREVSHIFTVVSGHAPLTNTEHKHLVGLGGTIVVLMGVATLPHLMAGLERHGMAASTPMAIVESAFSDRTRTTFASVGTAIMKVGAAAIRSPAVVIIGEVVRLAEREDAAAVDLFTGAARLVTPA